MRRDWRSGTHGKWCVWDERGMRNNKSSRKYILIVVVNVLVKGYNNSLGTFFTNESTTFFRTISSASLQRPRTSYVRRHSSTSAMDFVLSVSDVNAVANTLSRSENSVDFMRSTR